MFSAGKSYRVGIMGGTFDPIHLGHLVAAEAAREEFELERVIFVPASLPPHKLDQVISSAEHRLAMTLLATAGNPGFLTSRIELDRPGPSYTVETLEQLTRELPRAELFFITGADAVLELHSWKEPNRLLTLCQLIAVSRPGYDRQRLHGTVARLEAETGHTIRELGAPALAISSRELRQRAAEGRSLRYLVPREVADYIVKTGLYRGN